MSKLKKANKVFAVLLILVMFLTNPVFIGSLYAASTENKNLTTSAESLTLDARKEAIDAETEKNWDYSNLTDEQRFNQFVNRMIPYYVKGGKKNGLEWLRTTDFRFSFTENYKPMFSITTVQPFSKVDENGQMLFWQGRYAQQSDNNTANLGVGWRKLSSDKKQMIGLNLFYDYGFQYDLSRVGMGMEYFNKLAEYRANFYLPTSGDRITNVSDQADGILYSYIRAVRGLDYEIGTSFDHARWLSLYASGYFYDNKYNEDEKGYKLRSVMQLTPRVSLEAGYDKSNLSTGGFYGKIAYRLADCFGSSLSGGDKEVSEKPIDLTHKLLQKVERNNNIKTETFTKFVAYQGSVNITLSGAMSANDYIVTVTDKDSVIHTGKVKSGSTTATISNIPEGNCTVAVTAPSGYTAAVNPTSFMMTAGGSQAVTVTSASQVVTGTVAVTVSFSDHATGITPTFREGSTTLTPTTTSGNVYTFTLPAGSHTIMVSAAGYNDGTVSTTVTSGGTQSQSVTLTPMVSTGTVNITVTNGAAINPSFKEDTTTLTPASTSGDDYTFNLPAGSHTIMVSATGYNDGTVTTTVTSGGTDIKSVTLTQATYDITTSAGAGGSISPSGITAVNYNSSSTYTITASSGYKIVSITVDGVAVTVTTIGIGGTQAYIFSNVISAHTIEATFVVAPPSNYTVDIQVNTTGVNFSTGNYVVKAYLSNNGGGYDPISKGEGTIDASGHAVITNLPAGTYGFFVSDKLTDAAVDSSIDYDITSDISITIG